MFVSVVSFAKETTQNQKVVSLVTNIKKMDEVLCCASGTETSRLGTIVIVTKVTECRTTCSAARNAVLAKLLK